MSAEGMSTADTDTGDTGTGDTAAALALLADAAAAAVVGVTRVYPVGGAAARAARQALGVTPPLSRVGLPPAPSVEVGIGVEGDPAVVGARVSDAVRAALAPRLGAGLEVRIRISRAREARA